MHLPHCIFIIRSSSGIPATAVDDLVRHADEAYRVLDVVTDLPVTVDVHTDAVRVIPWPEPGLLPGLMGHNIPYDVVLFANPESSRENLVYFGEPYNPVMSWPKWGAPDCWTCWVEPRGDAITRTQDEADAAAQLSFATGVVAHWTPRVVVGSGRPLEVIVDRSSETHATPSPTTDWTAVWQVVFRACGKYRGRLETHARDL